MILKNAKIFTGNSLKEGSILINSDKIKQISLNERKIDQEMIRSQNLDGLEINCEGRIILPGIIDIHAHLRDMEQSDKESFKTGTKAAAFSGITTVFNMPNTKPPAISAKQVEKWMKATQNKIFVDVAFISGVPNDIDDEEIKKIINLGVIGFKIYPLKPLNNCDWYNEVYIKKLLLISSLYRIPIFIHPDWSHGQDEKIFDNKTSQGKTQLKIYDQMHPCKNETKYIEFILKNYFQVANENQLPLEKLPIIHFCHVSCKSSIEKIQESFDYNIRKKMYLCKFEPDISFEVTPHHLFLSNDIELKNPCIGKVLPPLRDKENSLYLNKQLDEGTIKYIGTDHAPHTLQEKTLPFFSAPSGFPGFETYTLILLDRVLKKKMNLSTFVGISATNPAKRFNLKLKGKIKEGYYADLIIVEKTKDYEIKSTEFRSKAKYTPFENSNLTNRLTSARIWKTFLRGNEITEESLKPSGIIIRNNFK
jgi:dihydroorotase